MTKKIVICGSITLLVVITVLWIVLFPEPDLSASEPCRSYKLSRPDSGWFKDVRGFMNIELCPESDKQYRPDVVFFF